MVEQFKEFNYLIIILCSEDFYLKTVVGRPLRLAEDIVDDN